MQHRKSLDFVHTLKETAHFEQLLFTILLQGRFPPRIQRSQGVGQINACSLNMLLQVLVAFTIVFVFFTIVTVSCCIPFSVLLFPLQQAFEVSATALSPRRALVLLLILRPKRQGFGKSWNERRDFSLLLYFLLLRSLISVERDLLSFAACKREIQGLVMFSISKDFSILMAPANMDFQTPLWIRCEVTMVTFKLLGASALVRGSRGDSSVLLHQPARR